MARLRVRVELNRGGQGVPLNKLASVVGEAQKFFHLLAEDVHIDKGKGEWLGFEFDNESLNFTAEYVGPVTAEQVSAFYAAFDGTTSLRRGTIAQFARITEAVGEDELIGFGLYQSDDGAEPSEWRCLSRRDALRIAGEIQLLSGPEDAPVPDSHLPAVQGADMGARLFGERRDRGLEPGKLPDLMREVETALSKRLTRVENRLEDHDGSLRDLRSKSATTEDSFRHLLSAVEGFCDQAAHQIERIAPPPLPAPRAAVRERFSRNWHFWAIGAASAVALVTAGLMLWPGHASETPVHNQPPATAAAAVPPRPAPAPATPAAPAAGAAIPVQAPAVEARGGMQVDLEASEATWISVVDADRKTLLSRVLNPGEVRRVEVDNGSVVRTGNAGGTVVKLNGKSIGPLGPHGRVREIEFRDGAFKIIAPAS